MQGLTITYLLILVNVNTHSKILPANFKTSSNNEDYLEMLANASGYLHIIKMRKTR